MEFVKKAKYFLWGMATMSIIYAAKEYQDYNNILKKINDKQNKVQQILPIKEGPMYFDELASRIGSEYIAGDICGELDNLNCKKSEVREKLRSNLRQRYSETKLEEIEKTLDLYFERNSKL